MKPPGLGSRLSKPKRCIRIAVSYTSLPLLQSRQTSRNSGVEASSMIRLVDTGFSTLSILSMHSSLESVVIREIKLVSIE